MTQNPNLQYNYQRLYRLFEIRGTVDKTLADRFDITNFSMTVSVLRRKGHRIVNVDEGTYRLLP